MQPGKYNITMFRGSTFNIGVKAEDADGPVEDYNQTYNTAELIVYEAWARVPEDMDGPTLLEIGTATGHVIIGTDTISILMNSTETAALPFNEGVYILKLIASGTPDLVDVYLGGKFTVKNEVH